MENNYYFYVLRCVDDTFYGGFSTNVLKRVATHNAGKGAKYTKGRGPVTLIHAESFPTKSDALKAEYAFKHQSRQEKINYLKMNEKKNIMTQLKEE